MTDIMWNNINFNDRLNKGVKALSLDNNQNDLAKFNDDDMLYVITELYKIHGEATIAQTGQMNIPNRTFGSFLDLAIYNGNPKSLNWILNNTSTLMTHAYDEMMASNNIPISFYQWLKKNGIKLITYIINNTTDDELEGVIYPIIEETAHANNWDRINNYINGLADLPKNNPINNYILTSTCRVELLKLIVADNIDAAKWILRNNNCQWNKAKLITHSPINGNIQSLLKNNTDALNYVLINYKALKLNLNDWIPQTAQNTFMF